MKTVSLFILCFTVGCATAGKINKISLGMTKSEVINQMGNPDSSKASETTEILVYQLYDSSNAAMAGATSEYWVKLIDGKVTRYGRPRDIDSSIGTGPGFNIDFVKRIR